MDDGGTSNTKPAWASALKVYVQREKRESGWRRLCRQLAQETPSETDYVYEEWTHTKIAWEYILLMYQQGIQMNDG